MITVTLSNLLYSDLDENESNLYIVRDGEVIFYVGQSGRGIRFRLFQHHRETSLGNLIQDNLPDSMGWQIDLLTVQDCLSQIKKHFPYISESFILKEDNAFIDRAEEAMIRELRPCLNGTWNLNPNPLPDKYKRPEEAKRKAAGLLHVPYRGRLVK
jgi:hypothetical protein